MSQRLYPTFVNLRRRTCVVVGGGEMAEAKIRDLLDTGAQIKVISPTATTAITSWSQTGQLEWQPRAYARGDLREAFLVISVTDSRTNAVVFAEAEELHRLCNAVDDPVHCNCYAGAIVRRGALQVAISTAGKSPALAQRLRGELEQAFESEYEPWVDELGEQRSSLLRDRQIDSAARRKILHEHASATAFNSFRDSLRRAEPGHPSRNNSSTGNRKNKRAARGTDRPKQ